MGGRGEGFFMAIFNVIWRYANLLLCRLLNLPAHVHRPFLLLRDINNLRLSKLFCWNFLLVGDTHWMIKPAQLLPAPLSAETKLVAGRRHDCDAENVLGGSAQHFQAAGSPFLLEQESCEYLRGDHGDCAEGSCDLLVLYVSICEQALILSVVIAFFTIFHLSK